MNYRMTMFRDTNRTSVEIPSVLFVDPGLGGTGFACFLGLNTKVEKKYATKPAGSGVITFPRSKGEDEWLGHVHRLVEAFRGCLSCWSPHLVVIEQPQLWAGDAKSHAATTVGAKGEPGDLFKLTYLIGQLGYVAKGLTGAHPILIHPYEWKGQLSKELVIERISRFGIKPKDHEADAIGMGFAAQGLL